MVQGFWLFNEVCKSMHVDELVELELWYNT